MINTFWRKAREKRIRTREGKVMIHENRAAGENQNGVSRKVTP
jgi:hypothetical protein